LAAPFSPGRLALGLPERKKREIIMISRSAIESGGA